MPGTGLLHHDRVTAFWRSQSRRLTAQSTHRTEPLRSLLEIPWKELVSSVTVQAHCLDGEVNSKLEGSGHDVRRRNLTWLHERSQAGSPDQEQQDDFKECCHENCSCNERFSLKILGSLEARWLSMRLDSFLELRSHSGSLGCAVNTNICW